MYTCTYLIICLLYSTWFKSLIPDKSFCIQNKNMCIYTSDSIEQHADRTDKPTDV